MEITIDGNTFTLLGKMISRNYLLVRIQTKDTMFHVYPSNSELGMWRFCVYNHQNLLHKGKNTETANYTYDYVQTTLLHFDLQQFINETLGTLPWLEGACGTIENDDLLDQNISNPERQIHEKPFIYLQRTIQCGETKAKGERIFFNGKPVKNEPFDILRAFSNQLEGMYTIIDNRELFPYSTYFQNIIRVNGTMNRVVLRRNEQIEGSQTNIIMLYYLNVKLTKDIHKDAVLEADMIENINFVCELTVHYMPCMLTTPEATCNSLGLYTKYIPCGAFVCKLFDYYNPMQCSAEEVACGKITRNYSYIGSRYLYIFPFKHLKASAPPSEPEPESAPAPAPAPAPLAPLAASGGKRRYTRRKGGLFGYRSLKTKSDNQKNCRRLAENYKPKYDLLNKIYKCDKYSPDCSHINTHAGLHFICANDKFIDAYDFNREGTRVKKRTEPFVDLKTIPQNVNGYPWNDMPHYFKEEKPGEYEFKTDQEMFQKR